MNEQGTWMERCVTWGGGEKAGAEEIHFMWLCYDPRTTSSRVDRWFLTHTSPAPPPIRPRDSNGIWKGMTCGYWTTTGSHSRRGHWGTLSLRWGIRDERREARVGVLRRMIYLIIVYYIIK